MRAALELPLRWQRTSGRAVHLMRAEPVSFGIPWPRGALLDTSELRVLDDTGAPQLLQARALDHWSDGSVRWVLLDLFVPVETTSGLRIGQWEAEAVTEPPASALRFATDGEGTGLEVGTGTHEFIVNTDGSMLVANVLDRRGVAEECAVIDLHAEEHTGERCELRASRLEVEEAGSVRIGAALHGELIRPDGTPLVDCELRLHFYAHGGLVRAALTLRNTRRAGHPGGNWSLGCAGSVYLRDVSLALRWRHRLEACRVSLCPDDAQRALGLPLTLYQDSSGGENWDSRNHLNRDGRVPNRMRGFELVHPGARESGLRATPVVEFDLGSCSASLGMQHFWQNCPKALRVTERSLQIGLFPREYADVFELQGGEQKTHHVSLSFDERPRGFEDWIRDPLVAHAPPAWYAQSGVVRGLVSQSEDPHHRYVALVEAAIEGEQSFESKREVIDEYGWRHFGDLFADHESAFLHGPTPFASHYNNQYDAVAGFLIQFFRTGDIRWWRLFSELASHVVDIDIYHTTEDKSAYNGGMFWHTGHYIDAATSAHRTYPPGTPGGGLSPEHLYTWGLLLHHFLTGERLSHDVVVGGGRYVIDADDGAKTIYRFLDRDYTGYISCVGPATEHGPGRAAGNALDALLNAFTASGERAFIDKAEQLIRRCVHPADDIGARGLDDVETRWPYMLFLKSLGQYLELKIELGELDARYAYARESLLHYARWARDNEHPSLERPEILDFPTETWAAQDIRKAEVFDYAAMHAADTERGAFAERADFFFRSSVESLNGMATHASTRPLVLLLSSGYRHAGLRGGSSGAAPMPNESRHDFGEPMAFATQKHRVKRKLKHLAITAAALGVVGVSAILLL